MKFYDKGHSSCACIEQCKEEIWAGFWLLCSRCLLSHGKRNDSSGKDGCFRRQNPTYQATVKLDC